MKINLRAMMLATGLMIGMIPFMPREARAAEVTGQEKRGLMDITYMQEMAPNICTNSKENDTKQLIDRRDGKSYWVTKLKDGNCWMTQNLDLDLKTNKPLTSADSDVENWIPSESTATSINSNFDIANNNVKSWDPAHGGTATHCNDGTTAGKCKASGNPTTSVNNGHDAQGNYYSWGAATAGQASSISTAGQNATQSICPKGWQLPTSNSITASKSFGYLLNGLSAAQITTSPYYFIYGGYVNDNHLYNAGSTGHYWSSTANSDTRAYILLFSSTGVDPSSYSARYSGFSVRCVARTDSTIPDNNNNVTISVTPTLSLDIAATANIPYKAGDISTGTLSATVKSNQQHAIQLSATQPNLVNEADSTKFIPANASVSAGTSAWGIKKKQSAASTPLGSTTDVSAYTALTSTPDIFYRSAAGSEGAAPINFSVGISTDPALASGTYSTNVTITATTI